VRQRHLSKVSAVKRNRWRTLPKLSTTSNDGVAEHVIADRCSFVPSRVIILQFDGHIA
jgi:hypothetical protein